MIWIFLNCSGCFLSCSLFFLITVWSVSVLDGLLACRCFWFSWRCFGMFCFLVPERCSGMFLVFLKVFWGVHVPGFLKGVPGCGWSWFLWRCFGIFCFLVQRYSRMFRTGLESVLIFIKVFCSPRCPTHILLTGMSKGFFWIWNFGQKVIFWVIYFLIVQINNNISAICSWCGIFLGMLKIEGFFLDRQILKLRFFWV